MADPVVMSRPSPPYDPANWYWFVGSDLTQVYSSAAAAYVPSRDATFAAWVAAGHKANKIATEQELWDYLNGRVLNGTPTNAASTDVAKQQRLDAQLSEIIYTIALSHENRIRALEGFGPLTQQQFFDRIKGLMK